MAQDMESAREAAAAAKAGAQGISVSEEVRQLQLKMSQLAAQNAQTQEEIKRHIEEARQETKTELQSVLTNQGQIIDLLNSIMSEVTEPPEVASTYIFGWGGNMQTYQLPTDSSEVIKMSDISLPDTDSGSCQLTVLDGNQNSFVPNTPPTWTADPTTLVTLNVAPDGMSATADPVPGGGDGPTTVTIQVTNNDGTAANPATTTVTTTATDAGQVSTAWSDTGVTVTTPPAS